MDHAPASATPKRIVYLDALRALAILLVVFTHAHELAGVAGSLAHKLYCVDRMGVPLFLMISGALIIPRAARKGCMEFYRKRIPQFLLIILFWAVLTNTVYNCTTGGDATPWQAFMHAAAQTNGLFPAELGHAHHLGFMYAITGLYLLVPFISRGLVQLGQGGRVALVAVMLLLQFPPCSLAANLGSCGSLNGYAVYFVMGYVISEWRVERLGWRGAAALACLLAAAVAGSYFLGSTWYTQNPGFYLSSACLFLLFKVWFAGSGTRCFSGASKASFGVYLVHLAIMYPLIDMVPGSWGLSPACSTLLYFAAAYCISWGITALLLKARGVRYLLS